MPADGPGELTLRMAPAGGPLRTSVLELHGSPAGADRIALFIHGYNNSHEKACRSFHEMWNRLEREEVNHILLNQVFWLYWPGDKALWGISHASYAEQVGVAQEAGATLAAYLMDLQLHLAEPLQVVIVAHSLGSRLALETVRWLRIWTPQDRPNPVVMAYALMAAAVPVGHMETRFSSVDAVTREVVLFSLRDGVLRWGFPAGQTLASEMGLDVGSLPQAVGYRGRPAVRWLNSAETGYKHGGYWSGAYSSSQIARLFGRTPARRPEEHAIVEWEIPEVTLASSPVRSIVPGRLCDRVPSGIYA